jgi:chromosome segregation ATPase
LRRTAITITKTIAKGFVLLTVGIGLLLSPYTAVAQWGAGRGGRSTGTASRPSTPGDDPTIAGLSRAIAAQATEAQQQQFQSAAQSADTAKKLAEDLSAYLARVTDESPDYVDQWKALGSALDKTKAENDKFLQSFSKIQISEWKDLVKKLKKAAGEVDGKWKALDKESEQAKASRQKLSQGTAELAQALTNFRRQQQALGTEMGVQPPQQNTGQAPHGS